MRAPSEVQRLRNQLAAEMENPLLLLTERELEIAEHVGFGRNNAQIAAALGIAEGTVKQHVKSILLKLEDVEPVQVRGSRAKIAAVYHRFIHRKLPPVNLNRMVAR